jgi:hypothetical protein
MWDPIVCILAECTSTVSYIWPGDSSVEPKHVTEFLILITNTGCVIDWIYYYSKFCQLSECTVENKISSTYTRPLEVFLNYAVPTYYQGLPVPRNFPYTFNPCISSTYTWPLEVFLNYAVPTYYQGLPVPRNVPQTFNPCSSSPNIFSLDALYGRVVPTHFPKALSPHKHPLSNVRVQNCCLLLAVTVAVKCRYKHQFAKWCVLEDS